MLMRVKCEAQRCWILALGCLLGAAGCQYSLAAGGPQASAPSKEADATAEQNELKIDTTSPLPDTYPRAHYEWGFHAKGGVPPMHWRVDNNTLPRGMTLEEGGRLHGEIDHAGEFRILVVVTDSGKPQQSVQKEFVLRVISALSLKWLVPAYVTGNRIQGSASVSNTTPDDIDLTFIVEAVAENGRGTAIGYQHFVLHPRTVDMSLPFGEILPHGAYIVHVDAVGEVEKKRLIYRERMQTPGPLQVTVGP